MKHKEDREVRLWSEGHLKCTPAEVEQHLLAVEKSGIIVSKAHELVCQGEVSPRETAMLSSFYRWLGSVLIEAPGFCGTLQNVIRWELDNIDESSFEKERDNLMNLADDLRRLNVCSNPNDEKRPLGSLLPEQLFFQEQHNEEHVPIDPKILERVRGDRLRLAPHDLIVNWDNPHTNETGIIPPSDPNPGKWRGRVYYGNSFCTVLLGSRCSAYTRTRLVRSNQIKKWFVESISSGVDFIDPFELVLGSCYRYCAGGGRPIPKTAYSAHEIKSTYTAIHFGLPIVAGVMSTHYVWNGSYFFQRHFCDGSFHDDIPCS